MDHFAVIKWTLYGTTFTYLALTDIYFFVLFQGPKWLRKFVVMRCEGKASHRLLLDELLDIKGDVDDTTRIQ